jgi:hypothetical protein
VAEKRMLIVDAEVARKIDENRGDMSYSEFVNFLIESRLKEQADGQVKNYVPREEFDSFVHGMKELLRNFMEFFISYEVELGDKPDDEVFKQLSQKLKSLGGAGK